MVYEGNCRLGDLFESRRERGRAGLPLLSVTMNDGLVERDDLDRKQDTNLAPEDHLLVKPGDIAYNMMRMWQGAFGLADREGLVSPAYIVLKPKNGVDSTYASYLLQCPRLRYLLWAYSYGITDDRLRLYFNDFARIPASVPDLNKQRRIGTLFAAWDSAIAASERAHELDQIQSEQIAKRLLSSFQLRNRGKKECPLVRLRDVAQIISSSVDKHQVAGEKSVLVCGYTDVYYNKHLSQTYQFQTGSASDSEIERFSLRPNDVVITKDSEEANDIGVASCVIDEVKGLVCGYHLAIVRPNQDLIDGVFLAACFGLWHVRKHLAIQANGVTRFGLPLKSIESIQLALPPLSEQRRIREVLLALESNRAIQAQSLAALKRERQALEQRMFGQVGK